MPSKETSRNPPAPTGLKAIFTGSDLGLSPQAIQGHAGFAAGVAGRLTSAAFRSCQFPSRKSRDNSCWGQRFPSFVPTGAAFMEHYCNKRSVSAPPNLDDPSLTFGIQQLGGRISFLVGVHGPGRHDSRRGVATTICEAIPKAVFTVQ